MMYPDTRSLMNGRLVTLCAAFVLLFLAGGPVWAQTRVLVVESNMPEAHVFIEGEWAGNVGSTSFMIPLDAVSGSVKPASLDAWSIEPITFAVEAAGTGRAVGSAGPDTVRVEAYFPYHYRVESIPPGADVFLMGPDGDSWLGSAPLLHVSPGALAGELRLSRNGFETVRVTPGADIWNRHLVSLPVRTEDVVAGVGSMRPPRRRRWIDVAALTGAAAAGALAVHYRTKADNRFRRWEETGDPAVKDRVQQLDVYSGVSVGAMQVGLGVFAFRLIF